MVLLLFRGSGESAIVREVVRIIAKTADPTSA